MTHTARTRFANLPVAAAREASKSAVVPRPRFKELRRRLDEVPLRRDAREAHKRLLLPSEDLVQQMSELCAQRTVLEGCSGCSMGSVWSVHARHRLTAAAMPVRRRGGQSGRGQNSCSRGSRWEGGRARMHRATWDRAKVGQGQVGQG